MFESGDRPTVFLGLAVVLEGVEWLAWALCSQTPAYGTPLGDALSAACRIGISASLFCLLLFTRLAFRSDSRAASGFVWLISGAVIAGFLGTGMRGDWGGFENDNLWIWLENVAHCVGYVWCCVEPGRYYARLRRRVRHGLADPIVANRFLLWAVYAGALAVSQGCYLTVLASLELLDVLDVFIVAITVTGELGLWLAFFPPARYRAWVQSGTASEATG